MIAGYRLTARWLSGPLRGFDACAGSAAQSEPASTGALRAVAVSGLLRADGVFPTAGPKRVTVSAPPNVRNCEVPVPGGSELQGDDAAMLDSGEGGVWVVQVSASAGGAAIKRVASSAAKLFIAGVRF